MRRARGTDLTNAFCVAGAMNSSWLGLSVSFFQSRLAAYRYEMMAVAGFCDISVWCRDSITCLRMMFERVGYSLFCVLAASHRAW